MTRDWGVETKRTGGRPVAEGRFAAGLTATVVCFCHFGHYYMRFPSLFAFDSSLYPLSRTRSLHKSALFIKKIEDKSLDLFARYNGVGRQGVFVCRDGSLQGYLREEVITRVPGELAQR